MRAEAEKQQQAAQIALQEMVKNLRFVSPEQRQQIITSGIFAVVAKDPSMLAGLMKQFSDKSEPGAGATTRPSSTTRPARPNVVPK